MSAKESWKNSTLGTHFVLKYDKFGNPVHEVVGPGRMIALSREERIMNQENSANAGLDPFQNGILTPVRLVDDEDVREFAENPNLMTEDDMKALLKSHWKVLDAKISSITNSFTLNRLRELAQEVDVSVNTMKRINQRISEVAPQLLVGVAGEVETLGQVKSLVGPDGIAKRP